MTGIRDTRTQTLVAVADALARLRSAEVAGLDDAALLGEQHAAAEARRLLDTYSAVIAGEIAHRSRRELGYSGLAQREGFRSATSLVQSATGFSARDAVSLVQVGGLLHDDSSSPWLTSVTAAVSDGSLSVFAADAIATGLGKPRSDGSTVTVDDLTAASRRLVGEAVDLSVDDVRRRTREVRDELDATGVEDLERVIFADRSIRRYRRPNGVTRYIIDPDIETAALLDDIVDKLMSPRRGGPRFVDPDDRAWAQAIELDPRTPEQYLHDSFTQIVRLGVTADSPESRRIVGSRVPGVRVLVPAEPLATGVGAARIEGQEVAVSIATAQRTACTAGTVAITFDRAGRVIDLGREQRLFTPAQKIALAARDGGCMIPDCPAPASWTEAHHIRHWHRDRGRTDVADGILLCRFHHLLMHNNHWEIERRRSQYWLIPPADVDPARTARLLSSKSLALRDLLAG